MPPPAISRDPEPPPASDVFPSTGEMGRICREKEWSETPLGPVGGWPQSLRTAAGMVVGSAFPSIVLWGPELIQIYNDGYIPVHGEKHPWGLGRPTREVWPEVWEQNAPLFERAMSGETVWVEDAPYALARRGPEEPPDEVFVRLSFSPILDEKGEVGGVLVTLLDTTAEVEKRRLQDEQRKLVDALELERARLEYLFRKAPSFFAVLRGSDHRFELVNEAYYDLVGRRKLLGRPVREAFPELRDQAFPELLDQVLATGEPFIARAVPVRLSRTPGDEEELRFVDLSYLPLHEADGSRSGVIAHGTDVTDHVRAQRELEDARAEAEAANEAKSSFLANMSHELRTPLNAIAGYVDLMEMEIHGPVTEAQRKSFERIKTNQRILLGLITDILNHVKLSASGLTYAEEEVGLGRVLTELEPMIIPQMSLKGLEYVHHSCGSVPSLRADEERVRQILLNLLGNAIKFTPSGGRIEVSCASKADRVLVHIRDSGIGIAPEKLESIFDPFVQVDPARSGTPEGTGLGLAISRDLARGMGGDITVTSSPSKGSTFSLSLPAWDG